MVPRWVQITVGCLCVGGLVVIVRQSRATQASPPSTAIAADPWVWRHLQRSTPNGNSTLRHARPGRSGETISSLTVLGQLHIRKARESGDIASYQRAETALRQALTLNAEHAPAKAFLASAYASQQSFHQAIELARELYVRLPARTDLLGTLADAYLETGQYKEGELAGQELARKAGRTPPVLARLALVAELHGRSGEAVQHLQQAVATLKRDGESGHEVVWYETRLGDLYFHNGCLDEAATHLNAALALVKGHYIGLAGLAEVRAAQGRTAEAEQLFTEAVAAAPQVHTLFAFGRFYESHGRHDAATPLYAGSGGRSPRKGFIRRCNYRDPATFYMEQPGQAADALDLARRDLAVRRDIEGLDTLAWALYKNGRIDEAAAASDESMKLGTHEPAFYYHAAMIAARLGQRDKARGFLERGFALGAYHFNDEARETLRKLGGVPEGPTACPLGKTAS